MNISATTHSLIIQFDKDEECLMPYLNLKEMGYIRDSIIYKVDQVEMPIETTDGQYDD